MFTASDVLLKASSRIEEEGMWCQGQQVRLDAEAQGQLIALGHPLPTDWIRDLQVRLYEAGMRVPECAEGAIAATVIELRGRFDFDLHLDALCRLGDSLPDISVVAFNDRVGQTAHEVAEAMRRAAL